MLSSKLKDKEYYLNKLTLFMRNSYGIEQQVELLWKVLTDIDSSIDDVFTALSMSFEEIDNIDDTLDKLAELVGTKRQLGVSYLFGGVLSYFTLELSNLELLRAIQTRILQNNYAGTFEEFIANYQRIGLEALVFDSGTSGKVFVTVNASVALTPNDRHLFLSGNYTIRSLGIEYEHTIQDLEILAIWDAVTSVFDTAQWGG